MSYGAQIKFGIARQATVNSWAVDAGSYHSFGILSEDVGLQQDELISGNLTGRFEQGASYAGLSRINGAVDVELTPRALGAALAAVVDYAPTTVTSGSVKTYTFLPNTVDFSATLCNPPFSIYKQFADANSAECYYDAQFSQLQLSFATGQFVKAKVTVGGGSRVPTGIGSLNVVPVASDVGRLFPWNVASASLGGAALAGASEIVVNHNESIAPIYALNGSLAPLKFTRTGFREVTVNGTFYMSDRAILNAFTAGTQQQLLLFITNSKTAIQSGYFDSLLIDIPQLKITAFKPGVSGPSEVSVSFTARGVLDPTSNYVAQYIVTNTYAAGY